MRTIGILLLNLGGPDSLRAVRPFLYNLFSDRTIIKLGPSFLQRPLAYLISVIRSRKAEALYRLIGGKSPLLEITSAQADALDRALNAPLRGGQATLRYRVYIGMRYWHPYIEDTVLKAQKEGIRELVALSLYPHYSLATSGSAISKFNDAVAAYHDIRHHVISQWYDHKGYIEALVDVIGRGIEEFFPGDEQARGGEIHVLFSAHSLPMSIVEAGDPYVTHIRATIAEITRRMPITWHLSYQSKTGPVKWLEPTTEEKITELALKGVRNLLVVPISFVSDHIETLYEIDMLYKGLAERCNMRLKRTESLNTNPLFIEALCDIINDAVKEAGWTG